MSIISCVNCGLEQDVGDGASPPEDCSCCMSRRVVVLAGCDCEFCGQDLTNCECEWDWD